MAPALIRRNAFWEIDVSYTSAMMLSVSHTTEDNSEWAGVNSNLYTCYVTWAFEPCDMTLFATRLWLRCGLDLQ